jgi:hypothetical protein
MNMPQYQHYLKIHEQSNYVKLFPLDMLEFEFQWWKADHTTLLCQSQAPSQQALSGICRRSCYTLISLTVFQFCSSVKAAGKKSLEGIATFPINNIGGGVFCFRKLFCIQPCFMELYC